MASLAKSQPAAEAALPRGELEGFELLEALGSGAYGTVYRCRCLAPVGEAAEGCVYAAKRIAKANGAAYRSGLNEAAIADALAGADGGGGGGGGERAWRCPLVHRREAGGALWLVFECGGPALSNLIWTSVEGEWTRTMGSSERTYRVERGETWHALLDDGPRGEPFALLRELVAQLVAATQRTASARVVHGDIKPDNILLAYDATEGPASFRCRLCDFGSSFVLDPDAKGTRRVSSATPEYLAPECVLDATRVRAAPVWAIDMFAIGMIFFEIASGFPLWFPYNSRVADPPDRASNKKPRRGWTRGAVAVANREGAKIARRQVEIADDVPAALKAMPGKGVSRDKDAMDLLAKLLCANAHKRISPRDALNHPFLAGRATASP